MRYSQSILSIMDRIIRRSNIPRLLLDLSTLVHCYRKEGRKIREQCNSKLIFTILDCCYSGADKLSKSTSKSAAKAQEESASLAKERSC